MIRLSRSKVVELYARCREVERSLVRLLDPWTSWQAFQAYFTAHKQQGLAGLSEHIGRLLEAKGCSPPYPPGHQRSHVLALSYWRLLWGTCVGRWSRSRRMTNHDGIFCKTCLDAFLVFLQRQEKPNFEAVDDLRRAFLHCELIIEEYCPAWQELEAAHRVGHFDELPSRPGLPLDEFLKQAA